VDPGRGYSCLHKSAPSIPVLRPMPGRVEGNVTWLQVGLNSAGPAGMCRTGKGLLMAAWRARQWSISGPARAIWPNKRSRREWMVSDRGGHPVRRLTSELDTCWLRSIRSMWRKAPLVKGMSKTWVPCAAGHHSRCRWRTGGRPPDLEVSFDIGRYYTPV